MLCLDFVGHGWRPFFPPPRLELVSYGLLFTITRITTAFIENSIKLLHVMFGLELIAIFLEGSLSEHRGDHRWAATIVMKERYPPAQEVPLFIFPYHSHNR